jgi:hypothetical protein
VLASTRIFTAARAAEKIFLVVFTAAQAAEKLGSTGSLGNILGCIYCRTGSLEMSDRRGLKQ